MSERACGSCLWLPTCEGHFWIRAKFANMQRRRSKTITYHFSKIAIFKWVNHHHASTMSPALALSSPPFSTSYCSSTDVSHSFIVNPQTPLSESSTLQKFSSNLYSLVSTDFDHSFSDVLLYVSSCVVPLHRCILAARCPFFKSLFSKDKFYLASFAPAEQSDTENTKLKIDLGKLLSSLTKTYKVSYDAFMAVIGFLYSGHQISIEARCIDDQCLHEACRPVVDFVVEILGLSSVFEIIDLKTFCEHYLQTLIEKAQVDEALPILIAAKVHGADSLLFSCQRLVAVSNLDTIDIEKQLPIPLPEEILQLRCKMGLLQPEMLNPTHEKQCQRIWKALDSHDLELVQLLLKEGRVSLDGAYALHYAVAYCGSHLVKDILELGLADVNSRNNRGFTVLHVASMRLDPSILVSLLYKGANPLETTPDGRTSLQLCSRLMRKHSNDSSGEAASLQKERLCVEILYQAGTKNLFEDAAFPPVADEEELLGRLFYLENRVAFGRLLFPEEANLVLGITHLESTSEFTGLRDLVNESKRAANMDLNQVPSDQGSSTMSAKPLINEALVKRVEALQRTELSYIKLGSSEEHKRKKRRYSELQCMIAEAFQKDVAAMERHTPDK
ncbi:hypothetical protein L7F22_031324 [Adiantum nelumboides]|nr:hypothetical protein [Adiantum nelumboides]